MNEDYIQFEYRFPLCNYTEGITEYNKGYAQGVTGGGVPFVAELTADDEETNLSVIMPRIITAPKDGRHVQPRVIKDARRLNLYNVLDIGMKFDGVVDDSDYILNCLDYLESAGIFEFVSTFHNGYAEWYTDADGTELIRVSITLIGEVGEVAQTELDFYPFEK